MLISCWNPTSLLLVNGYLNKYISQPYLLAYLLTCFDNTTNWNTTRSNLWEESNEILLQLTEWHISKAVWFVKQNIKKCEKIEMCSVLSNTRYLFLSQLRI